jgi:hypothetical protein
MPGQELGTLAAVLGVGLLIFIPLAIYLSIKVGIRPTLALFTTGLWPRRRHGSQKDTDSHHRAGS